MTAKAEPGYMNRVKCRRCGNPCYMPAAPLEPCDELERAKIHLCQKCWKKAKAEYKRTVEGSNHDQNKVLECPMCGDDVHLVTTKRQKRWICMGITCQYSSEAERIKQHGEA